MSDPTETIRREMVQEINHDPNSRPALAEKYGQVWNTKEMQEDFEVLGFMAPFISVRRKSDCQKGSLTFQHDPRFYFDFKSN